jgi:hypothetical protein
MLTTIVGGQTLIARVELRFAGKRAETVAVKVDPTSVNLFDPHTQVRVLVKLIFMPEGTGSDPVKGLRCYS